MNGEPTKGIEDIVRRNVAALRSKANLTQQALADEMLLRGIAWTRETVAQVETTNRRLGFTEAIVVAACLDVPVARLTATGAATVAVGESEWTAAYLGAAIAGTTGDIFPPESYASPAASRVEPPVAPAAAPGPTATELIGSPARSAPPGEVPDRRRGERRAGDPDDREARGRRATDAPAATPQKTAERIERRLRLRVTAGDVDATAQRLWSRSLEAERERRVTDRVALTGGSLKTIRGHVSRDLDREIAHEMERDPERARARRPAVGRAEPGRGDLGGHPPQHHPGQQGLQRQRRHPVVELHPAPRARRPDHRRGVEGRRVRSGEPPGGVAARQARRHQRLLHRRVGRSPDRP